MTAAGLAVAARHREWLSGLFAAITAPAAAAVGPLRVGVHLELPVGLLPAAIAEVTAARPDTQVHLQHASSAAQFAALKAGELEMALARPGARDPAHPRR